MGTSSGPTPADLTPKAERLAKLRARKRDLETLLAAKNDLLKKLYAREAALTGCMTPDTSIPSPTALQTQSIDQQQQLQQQQQAQQQQQQHLQQSQFANQLHQQQQQPQTVPHHSRHKEAIPAPHRKQLAHRLSIPSTSNVNLQPPPPPPNVSSNVHSRHHTVTTEHITKLYYTSKHPETKHFSRVHETHFSSSHPDIATHHTHMLMSQERQSVDTLPLLYQYASQLKARSPHLSGLPHVASSHGQKKRETSRRNTLQRTQTYHLTSHSDYNNYLESVPGVVSQSTTHKHVQTFVDSPMGVPNIKPRNFTDQYSGQSNQSYHNVQLSPPSISSSQQINYINTYSPNSYSNQCIDNQDQKVKEKEWYESSLDSPSNANVGMNLSRESYGSLKKPLQRSPSVSQPRSSPDSNFNINVENHFTMLSPTSSQGALSPRSQTSNDVPFESPKNCTVVESGKWIPYREVSKPFEMSDFYKYSTKFRQNNNGNQKPKAMPCNPMPSMHMQSDDIQPQPPQEIWKSQY